MSPMQAAGLWSGLLILLLTILSMRVMLGRRRLRISLGDGREGELSALSRGFGNAAEYTPLMIGGLILMAQLGTGSVLIHVLGGAFFVGRLAHPLGLKADRATIARVIGMMLTWLPLIGAAVLILLAALRPI